MGAIYRCTYLIYYYNHYGYHKFFQYLLMIINCKHHHVYFNNFFLNTDQCRRILGPEKCFRAFMKSLFFCFYLILATNCYHPLNILATTLIWGYVSTFLFLVVFCLRSFSSSDLIICEVLVSFLSFSIILI